MISRHLYLNIVIRTLLVVFLSALIGYSVAGEYSVRLIIICTLAMVWATVSLISYLNTSNRNIRYFFDSVRNEDSNLTFPIHEKGSSLKQLYKSMNTVNEQIRNLRLTNSLQEQYFRRILEHLAAGIITFDKKGFIQHVNSAAMRLLSLDVLSHISQIARFDKRLCEAVINIKPEERKLVTVNKSGHAIQLSIKSASFGPAGNELTILSIQDISTELSEKEVDSWIRLIRVLRHEIMNSITPITSLSGSLENIFHINGVKIKPSDVSQKMIDTTIQGLTVIREQGKNLTSFIESYRRLTSVPKPEFRYFSSADLFSKVRILADSLSNPAGTTITFSCSNDNLLFYADDGLLTLVLINLIRNALEANSGNYSGSIVVTASADNKGKHQICVTDNGPGIRAELAEEIFIPFFTTRENGSGIGLSISRQIMNAHGGNLTVRSIPGMETTFFMTFPL